MPKYKRKKSNFYYEGIVKNISDQIAKGILKPGEKLTPVRTLSKNLRVSMTTVLQAYYKLQDLGLIEAKPQSGYFIKQRTIKELPETETLTLDVAIKTYKGNELARNIHELSVVKDMVSLGPGVPGTDILPTKKLNRILYTITKKSEDAGIMYEFPPGYYKLRREIAKRSNEWGADISPEDIIVTTGATEALALSLLAVAKPGDTILTESPNVYLLFQIVQSLGMKILEVPTNPKTGIETKILGDILAKHKVAACVVYPTINNPLGSIMPEENRKKLYQIFSAKDIPIIEGDVWGDLHFEAKRPTPLKAIDKKNLVLYFSSFTKTGAPGYRIGWVCPGRYFKKVKELKFTYTVSTPAITQMVIAEFLRSGGYKKSIVNLREIYAKRLSLLYDFISQYFPSGTKISKPRGGAFIWIELPKYVDALEFQQRAFHKNISIAPGPLYSTTDKFPNYIRLTSACPWNTNEIEKAIETLGNICRGFA